MKSNWGKEKRKKNGRREIKKNPKNQKDLKARESDKNNNNCGCCKNAMQGSDSLAT